MDALVEARVRDGDGDLRGQRGESALVVLVVVVDASVLEVDHADDLAFVDERDGQLGASLRVGRDVARSPCGRRARGRARGAGLRCR